MRPRRPKDLWDSVPGASDDDGLEAMGLESDEDELEHLDAVDKQRLLAIIRAEEEQERKLKEKQKHGTKRNKRNAEET